MAQETMTGMMEQRSFRQMTTGGSTGVMLGGVAAVVLAILGLAGVAPHYLVTSAAIALGIAMLFEGGLIASEYTKVLNTGAETSALAGTQLGGGLSGEALAGIAAIVLGILALVFVKPEVLVSVAAIVLGGGLIFGSGVMSRLNVVKIDASSDPDTAKQVARSAVSTAGGLQVLVGLSAVVLGILALISLAPLTLDLIAMLVVGSSFMLSGGAVTSRVLSYFS